MIDLSSGNGPRYHADGHSLDWFQGGWLRLLAVYLILTLVALPARSEPVFEDPLDLPAQMRSSPEKRPLVAVAAAGENLVAVGSRGMIIYSEDQGMTWSQARVPVQSDLLAVTFPTPSDGWAVGHDGVILNSIDGGKTWARQLDGRMAGDTFTAFYTAMGPEGEAALTEIDINYRAGPTLPWLDVWFENRLVGYVTGSYGLIAATTDGGKNWEPWLHHIDNEAALNLNSLRSISGNIYIGGERGQVYSLNRAQGYFNRTDTGYLGSFFGIAGISNNLLAYGLRGTVYSSADNGTSWQILDTPTRQTITAGIVRPDKTGFVLVDAVGQLLLIDKTASSVNLLPEGAKLRATGIAPAGPNAFVVTGLDGIKKIEVPQDAAATIH